HDRTPRRHRLDRNVAEMLVGRRVHDAPGGREQRQTFALARRAHHRHPLGQPELGRSPFERGDGVGLLVQARVVRPRDDEAHRRGGGSGRGGVGDGRARPARGEGAGGGGARGGRERGRGGGGGGGARGGRAGAGAWGGWRGGREEVRERGKRKSGGLNPV